MFCRKWRFKAICAAIFCAGANYCFSAAPVNDNFADRLPLTGTSISFTGTLAGATLEQDDLQWSPGGTGSRSVWWSWLAQSNGPVTISCDNVSGLNNNAVIVWHANHPYTDLASARPISPALLLPLRTACSIPCGTFSAQAWERYEIELIGSSPGTLPLRLLATNNPVLFEQPKSQHASLGESVLFFVNATGMKPLSYQWMKDGVTLAGETAPMLALANVTAAQEGSYSLIVSNSTGLAQSEAASLTIGNPISASITIRTAATGFITTLSGGPGSPYRLESSADLGIWIPEALFPLGVTTLGRSTSVAFLDSNGLSAVLANNGQVKFYRARPYVPANEQCNLNLKTIRLGKEFWARDNNREPSDTPTDSDWVPYLPQQQKPLCPLGGIYFANDATLLPACSISGHAIEEPR